MADRESIPQNRPFHPIYGDALYGVGLGLAIAVTALAAFSLWIVLS
jgi:hypothetical protein